MINESKILEQQAMWHNRSLQGCVYAGYIFSKNPSEVGLTRLCLLEATNKKLIDTINKLVAAKINDDNNCILSILLPNILSLPDFLSFLELCKTYSDWSIEDNEVYQNNRLVKIRVPLNSSIENEEQIFSWVLGFAPFEFLPHTRQSPYFEIMIPTKTKEYLKNKFQRITPTKQTSDTRDRGGTIIEAHLADVFIKGITDNPKMDNNLWANSIKRKNQILSNFGQKSFDDSNAKAKITFSYPSKS